MKSKLIKQEGFRIQDPGSRIQDILYWILDPEFLNTSTRLVNRILGNPGKNYQNIAR